MKTILKSFTILLAIACIGQVVQIAIASEKNTSHRIESEEEAIRLYLEYVESEKSKDPRSAMDVETLRRMLEEYLKETRSQDGQGPEVHWAKDSPGI